MMLSVIVPVYRVETTLNRCLESIINQNIADYEVILIDDGSPDKCPQICDEWARHDSHFRVIHKKNGGLSDARNVGIIHAKGEWITFVDSDDYLKEGTYSALIPLFDISDVIEFPIVKLYESGVEELLTMDNHTFQKAQDYWFQTKGYTHTYACNKLFRKELFQNIRFPEGKVFEDAFTIPSLLLQANRITTTSEGHYFYIQNHQGITQTAGGTQLEMLLEAHLNTLKIWSDDEYFMHALNIQMDVFRLTGKEPKLPLRRVSPFACSLSWKLRIKALLLNIMGMRGICKFNKFIHKWNRNH